MIHPAMIGQFAVLRPLGQGGMGVVYEVQDPTTGRSLALKTILTGDADPEAVERFLREAEALKRVRHPSVIQVHELGRFEQGYYLTQDLVEGQTLRALSAHAPLPPLEVAALGVELAGALQAVHEAGILHRDLKPENVMVRSQDGRPLLLDFGLAKHATAVSLTRTGALLGTPFFMSPEQTCGRRDLTPASDVYGLGATLYTAIAGRPPVEGAQLTDLLLNVSLTAPTPLRELRPEVPAGLDAVILRSLAKDPAERYPSARDLGEDLQRAIAGQTPLALRHQRSRARGRGATALVAVVLLALGGAAALRARGASDGLEVATSASLAPSATSAPEASPGATRPAAAAQPVEPRPDRLVLARGVGNKLTLFHLDARGALRRRGQTDEPGMWEPWTEVGVGVAALAAGPGEDGRLELFYADQRDGAVTRCSQDLMGGWSQPAEDMALTAAALALVRCGDRLVLAASRRGRLVARWQEGPNRGFPARNVHSTAWPQSTRLVATHSQDGRAEVFGLIGGTVLQTYQQRPGDLGTYQLPFVRDGLFDVVDLCALTDALGRIELFATTAEGSLLRAHQSAPNQHLLEPVRLPGEGYQVAAVVNGDRQLVVVATDAEGEIGAWLEDRPGGKLSGRQAVGARGTALALGVDADGAPVLASVDEAGEVRTRRRTARGTWQAE